MRVHTIVSTLLWLILIRTGFWRADVVIHLGGFFGSLTFGGYDTSRFEPNDVSFSFGSDIERDLLVDVRSITSTNSNGSTANLLPQSVLALIDSTVSPIYLPQAACDVFAETFGLTYNSTFKLYLIDDEIHKKMVASNPNITFTLGDQSSGGSTVDIVFPYSSFDLKAVFPRVSDVNWYFPLQPADNDTQYTLGRVFLQEA